MRTFLFTVAVAAGLLAAPMSTQADPAKPAAAPATVDPVMERKRALVKRYFNAIHMDVMLDSMMDSLTPMLENEMKSASDGVTVDQAKIAAQVVKDTMADFMPKYMDASIDLYADAFTEDELTQLDAFYESPVGQSVIQKMPALMPKAAALMQTMMPDLEADMKARMCAKMACPKSGEANHNTQS